MIETQKFIRKPLYVDAVRITTANFDEVVSWCQGEVLQDDVPGKGTSKKYIKVRVHNPKNPRQTKAFVGDWLLYTERGYKVYTNKAFHASFDLAEPLDKMLERAREAEGVTTPPTPIEEVEPRFSREPETHMTPQGEPIEVVEATPQAIADVVNEQQPTAEAEGKIVLSLEEQQNMDQDEIRQLLQSGEYILAQDLAA